MNLSLFYSENLLIPGQSIFAGDSCSGKCNQTGTDPEASCQCNTACMRYNDCCKKFKNTRKVHFLIVSAKLN